VVEKVDQGGEEKWSAMEEEEEEVSLL